MTHNIKIENPDLLCRVCFNKTASLKEFRFLVVSVIHLLKVECVPKWQNVHVALSDKIYIFKLNILFNWK